jgi:hypothetical protein
MQPPLPFAGNKNQLFSMFTVVDVSGGAKKREIRLSAFVGFFLTLYQQRLESLEKALKVNEWFLHMLAVNGGGFRREYFFIFWFLYIQ